MHLRLRYQTGSSANGGSSCFLHGGTKGVRSSASHELKFESQLITSQNVGYTSLLIKSYVMILASRTGGRSSAGNGFQPTMIQEDLHEDPVIIL